MKYALIEVPDDFEKGQCYDCPLYENDCCVLHCRYDECPLEMDILDKIRAEIDRQQKWLLQAGYTAYNVDIALDAIKAVVAESE